MGGILKWERGAESFQKTVTYQVLGIPKQPTLRNTTKMIHATQTKEPDGK